MENPAARDPLPSEAFIVELGGQVHSAHASYTAALKAGLALKGGNAQAAVKVYEAAERGHATAA
ncbi:MAG: hypothetical protein ACK4UO_18315 [Pseudolabrys sp.]